MFDYPRKAEFNRPLPKSKVYQFARPARPVRDRFVSQIGEIVWKYKLSPGTTNLPARRGIEEIQVFAITLKTAELHESVLRAMDKAIASPVFFELLFQWRVRFTAAWKRPNDSDALQSLVGAYFTTPWQKEGVEREPLPVALDLAGLYGQMLRRLIPVPAHPGETMDDQVERVGRIHAKQLECRRLDARLRRELQFNRKVEINAMLRTRQAELAQLQQQVPLRIML